MSLHIDLLNRRKCLHIYLNGIQSADNICDYRYGNILNAEKCVNENIDTPLVYENKTQSISELRMNLKDSPFLIENRLDSIDENSDKLDFDFNKINEIYNPNSKNQYKDLTLYGDDNTKDRYIEGNEFWNNPNKQDIDVNKKDNGDDFTKSAYERGRDFWNSLNKTIEFKK